MKEAAEYYDITQDDETRKIEGYIFWQFQGVQFKAHQEAVRIFLDGLDGAVRRERFHPENPDVEGFDAYCYGEESVAIYTGYATFHASREEAAKLYGDLYVALYGDGVPVFSREMLAELKSIRDDAVAGHPDIVPGPRGVSIAADIFSKQRTII